MVSRIVELYRPFLKSELWEKIWDVAKGKVTLTTNLRTIHSSWILLPVAVAFTVITSPLVMNLYGGPGSGFIIAGIITFLALVGQKRLGKHIANTYLNEIHTNNIPTLNEHNVWCARMSLFIISLILIMDVVSVASESYSWIYWVSVFLLILLIITTLLLTLPIAIKNKKEEKRENV